MSIKFDDKNPIATEYFEVLQIAMPGCSKQEILFDALRQRALVEILKHEAIVQAGAPLKERKENAWNSLWEQLAPLAREARRYQELNAAVARILKPIKTRMK